jgi:CRISPR-associated endonuclease/helicase Cas3
MIVTFISQCEKNALKKTRRVLDSFANRIGDNTWQTIITMEGLKAVKKLLRQTASKSTAVSCHWIRSSLRVELMWVVGNRSRFNSEGIVPVHTTADDSLILKNEYLWGNVEVIALLSSLAGMFHDIGKANKLFQNKIDPEKESKGYESYRHEWVSLRLFQAFVANKSDKEWLKALMEVDNSFEKELLKNIVRDGIDNPTKIFKELKPIAKIVAWLIVSHHRLPIYPYQQESNPPPYENIDSWLENYFDVLWNSSNSQNKEWTAKEVDDNWSFEKGTPFKSAYWQTEASELAKRALATEQLFEKEWFNQRFTVHLARLGLVLSDHYYSKGKATSKWQDRNYDCWANTDGNGLLKQKLDEHNIGVARNAYNFIEKLPQLQEDLPTLTLDDEVLKNSYKTKEHKKLFEWQDKSFKLAKLLQKETQAHGFFGINMASTGRGKTLANAKIMYGLADEKMGCRFNIALGLRTLTLQTGDALAKLLKLEEEDYAVLIGSQAVKKLYDEKNKAESEELEQESSYGGSESSEELIGKEQNIYYRGVPNNRILSRWLEDSPKLQKMIDAPLLISTIDHLIPATEGVRGGKQIAPMLRLLTSDLVLDEPDDFGLEDLPALCRLVNWTAMLGGKVLLSTATMPPALANALFRAYRAGWKDYSEVNGIGGAESEISCAWFDEFETKDVLVNSEQDFSVEHKSYINKRIKNLNKDKVILRKAKLLPIESVKDEVYSSVATTLLEGIYTLHDRHNQINSRGQTISVGLVRMANINPLVEVAKELLSMTPREDTVIHYCVYHSKFPLAMRSAIEEKLDRILSRDNENKIWEHKEIKEALDKSDNKHYIFVVLATSVAEVGRDHDYDWIIAEPSSMRSLIQLAGRIQRHRKKEPKSENFFVLSKNIKALKGEDIAYHRPGFETKGGYGNNRRLLKSKNLSDVLDMSDLKHINAVPRIEFKKRLIKSKERNVNGIYTDFSELEQWALFQRLLGTDEEKENATYWWKSEPTWSAEMQRRQPFRSSRPDANYALCLKNGDEVWCRENTTVRPKIFQEVAEIRFVDVSIVEGNHIWFDMDTQKEYKKLSTKFNLTIKEVGEQFGVLRLDVYENDTIEWKYNQFLGVFR